MILQFLRGSPQILTQKALFFFLAGGQAVQDECIYDFAVFAGVSAAEGAADS